VHEPWRMALSYLYAAFGEEMFDLDLPVVKDMGRDKVGFMVQMIKKRMNTPLSSSCGRLFDTAASLSSLCHKISFESQAAMAFEAYSAPPDGSAYRFGLDQKAKGDGDGEKIMEMDTSPLIVDQSSLIIDTSPLINDMVMDILSGTDQRSIGSKFHQTVIDMFVTAVREVRRDTKVDQVVLSGGVFHNGFLLSGMLKALVKEEFKVYTHTQVPCGDGGISLGQVIAADALIS